MSARIITISGRTARLRRDRTFRLRHSAEELRHEAPELARDLLHVIDRHTASEDGWRFVLFGPLQNRIVVRRIQAQAKRSQLSQLLWAELYCNFHPMTGEVLLTRRQMAAAIGARPEHVSAALAELLRFDALIRRQEGREVTWFMNPNIATGLTGAARDEAQRAAPRVVPFSGGAE